MLSAAALAPMVDFCGLLRALGGVERASGTGAGGGASTGLFRVRSRRGSKVLVCASSLPMKGSAEDLMGGGVLRTDASTAAVATSVCCTPSEVVSIASRVAPSSGIRRGETQILSRRCPFVLVEACDVFDSWLRFRDIACVGVRRPSSALLLATRPFPVLLPAGEPSAMAILAAFAGRLSSSELRELDRLRLRGPCSLRMNFLAPGPAAEPWPLLRGEGVLVPPMRMSEGVASLRLVATGCSSCCCCCTNGDDDVALEGWLSAGELPARSSVVPPLLLRSSPSSLSGMVERRVDRTCLMASLMDVSCGSSVNRPGMVSCLCGKVDGW